MKRSLSSLAGVAALALLTSSASAQEPSLDEVLKRVGAYVVEFQRQLSGIVAEEDYAQSVRAPTNFGSTAAKAGASRGLKSDLLLVKPAGVDRWIQFRDVFEVDGQPVRDRSERLMKLFLAPTETTATQAEQIATESSRYNIGGIERTVNVPVFALIVLDPRVQPRFKFKRGRSRQAPVRSAAADATWVVEYQEVEPETIIRTTFNRDMPAKGRFWIEPASGRVLATELVAEDVRIRGSIVVGYDVDPALKLLLPIEMREDYDLRRDGTRVYGNATYSKFRQFQVKVDEKIAPIK
jgi:hypothetical protein